MRTTLLVLTTTSEVELRFDPTRISEDYLRELVRIGPYRPEDLIVTDVVSGQQLLDFVEAMKAPEELAAAVGYVRRQVSFDLCLHRVELDYYRGNDEALKTRCDDIDPTITCSHWVIEAPLKRVPDARKFLAGYTWHNCMNGEFRDHLGTYPLETWRHFLNAFEITEVVSDIPFD